MSKCNPEPFDVGSDFVLMKKDIVGNVVFFPDAPHGYCYFYVDHRRDPKYLDDLSVNWDVRDELEYEKRMEKLTISIGRHNNQEMYIFARVVKGW